MEETWVPDTLLSEELTTGQVHLHLSHRIFKMVCYSTVSTRMNQKSVLILVLSWPNTKFYTKTIISVPVLDHRYWPENGHMPVWLKDPFAGCFRERLCFFPSLPRNYSNKAFLFLWIELYMLSYLNYWILFSTSRESRLRKSCQRKKEEKEGRKEREEKNRLRSPDSEL